MSATDNTALAAIDAARRAIYCALATEHLSHDTITELEAACASLTALALQVKVSPPAQPAPRKRRRPRITHKRLLRDDVAQRRAELVAEGRSDRDIVEVLRVEFFGAPPKADLALAA